MFYDNFIDIYKSADFDINEAKSEIDFVLDILFEYSYKDFVLGKNLSQVQILQAKKVFEDRIKTRKPIQQIVGKAFFFGYKFFVNEYTLIPRAETELLVNEVIIQTKKQNSIKILDLGTGTGCIGISLKMNIPFALCDLVDIQRETLIVAEKNAKLNNIDKGIRFIKSDIFSNIKDKYDVIVSNPPYIPKKDRETLQIEVRDFDSPIALFTNDDEGLEFYLKIISNAKKFLNKNGLIAFEVGINQAQKVKKILLDYDFSQIKVIKDFNSIERIVTARII